MRKRLQTLQRIVEVKEHLRRSAEWRLARLTRDELALLEDQRSVIAALNADQPLHGLFVEAMARSLRSTSEKLDRVRSAQAKERAELAAQTSQLRQGERALREVARQHERVAEGKALTEAVEADLARRDASLP